MIATVNELRCWLCEKLLASADSAGADGVELQQAFYLGLGQRPICVDCARKIRGSCKLAIQRCSKVKPDGSAYRVSRQTIRPFDGPTNSAATAARIMGVTDGCKN